MTLKEAYDRWVSLRPFKDLVPPENRVVVKADGHSEMHKIKAHYNGACCEFSHFKSGMRAGVACVIPLSDEEICPRALAWRDYIRIRDSYGLYN